ncbi:hypothetical protein NDA01_23480 [Trichocoleus desertorum AS-A10]|uniref:hypothetical protein n=1 Tax=Trichocoleus desertorum TaxID=1481672 RepID=UPI0032988350
MMLLRKPSSTRYQGIARKVDFRTDLGTKTKTNLGMWGTSHTYVNNIQVLTFRLELTDTHGNIIGLKAVELRGEKILGVICDGDSLEVIGKETSTGISQPQEIYNLTTSSEITVEQATGNLGGFFYTLVLLLLAYPILTFVYHVVFELLGPSFATFAVWGGLAYGVYLIVSHK